MHKLAPWMRKNHCRQKAGTKTKINYIQ